MKLFDRMPIRITLLSLLAAATAACATESRGANSTTVAQARRVAVAPLPDEGRLPLLDGATAWINSPPLTGSALKGKVVLVEFWTYTCINWLRTMPYTRQWAKTYADQGLVVIGVHTPEFGFEHDVANVRRAAKDLDVPFPIAIDNAQAVWNAFGNQYWPALYIIDAHGRIRHHQFGEGGYEESERVVRRLLSEAGSPVAGEPPLVTADGQGPEAAADVPHLRSPETYLGSARSERFAASSHGLFGQPSVYALPATLKLNDWGLAGAWNVTRPFAALMRSGGRIAYRFHARDVHLVMSRSPGGAPVRYRVRVDGRPPLDDHGTDVDADGNGAVVEPRLYQLVRQKRPIVDRLFEIEFLDPGVEAYAFTFG